MSAPLASADAARAVLLAAARVTGLPPDALRLDGDLDDELGIRAATRAEILRAAAASLGIEAPAPPAGPATLSDMARALMADPGSTSDAGGAKARLAGKVALVTGSGHGLGRVLVRELAALGASVVVNSFHSRDRGEATTAELVAEGHTAVHIWGSVAHAGQLDALFGEIEARFGRLDIFVNNASNGLLGPLDQVTPEHWDRSYRTNVVALHQGALRAAELMKDGGDIASITTPAAQKCTPLFGCQGSIKAAVEALIRYLSVELAPRGVRVNAIAPGPIYGELLGRYPDSARLVRLWEGLSAERRLRTEQEVARFIARFLGDPTLGVNGAVVLADSGVTAPMQPYP